MGLLKNISWTDPTNNTIVYKYECKDDYISKGSALTVRPSQVAIFTTQGHLGDVFLPGFYKLDSNSIPVITKLMSWKYGFENPFRSDIFFVNTKQFTNQKWGTVNPIIIRDKDYGAVRVRGFGTYAFRVKDSFVFMQELFGTNSTFKTNDIENYLRSIVTSGISDAIGQSKIPVLDMAGNLLEFGKMVEVELQQTFKDIGLELTKFNFENFSLPEELEKALDENTSLSMIRKNMDIYTQKAQADALKDAAKNQGSLGGFMGAGIGMGMGAHMGQSLANMGKTQPQDSDSSYCHDCGAQVKKGAKFCPECGTKLSGATCPTCGHILKAKTKFCPECGTKI